MLTEQPKKQGLHTKARLAALLALFFLSAQFFAAVHSAAYGKNDHLHNGHPCIVASIVKKSSDMDVAVDPVLDLENQPAWLEALPEPTVIARPALKAGHIRAPPQNT